MHRISVAAWHIFAKNFPPIVLAIFLGFVAIEVLGDRTIETIQVLAITPDPVKSPATATLIFQGKQSNDCDGVTHRYVVDSAGTLIQLDDAPVFHHEITSTNYGKNFTFTKPLPVPGGLAPGAATYHAEVVRWCNVFQEFLWPVRSYTVVKFNIAK
jgi:hypothetical protein